MTASDAKILIVMLLSVVIEWSFTCCELYDRIDKGETAMVGFRRPNLDFFRKNNEIRTNLFDTTTYEMSE